MIAKYDCKGTYKGELDEKALAEISSICRTAMKGKYPDADETIINSLNLELECIKNEHVSVLLLAIVHALNATGVKPYEMMLRGQASSSLVLYLLGLSEVDPIRIGVNRYFYYGLKQKPTAFNWIEINCSKLLAEGLSQNLKKEFAGLGKDLVCELNENYDGAIFRGELNRENQNILKCTIYKWQPGEILSECKKQSDLEIAEISIEDSKLMEMFDGTFEPSEIPEFSNKQVHEAVKIIKPRDFDDLVKIYGLMYGTGVWEKNAKELIGEDVVTIKDVVALREDAFDCLIKHGFSDKGAFDIAELVRSGKAKKETEEWQKAKDQMISKSVPEWFIKSCEQIDYLFPKAHGYACVLNAWRIAFYQQNR